MYISPIRTSSHARVTERARAQQSVQNDNFKIFDR